MQKYTQVDQKKIEDLIKFQNWIIYDFDQYNSKKGTESLQDTNWAKYFLSKNESITSNEKVRLQAKDEFVGDQNHIRKIDFSDPECVFVAAGGDVYYKQKTNIYTHNLKEIRETKIISPSTNPI